MCATLWRNSLLDKGKIISPRVAIMPIILPIGAITSFLGGPLFLYLLFKGGKQAFTFFNRKNGESLRLMLKSKPEGMTREDGICGEAAPMTEP